MGQSTPVVSKISVEGNQVTKEYIIRREIQHPLDVQLDSTIVIKDRDRIDNLAIFSSVLWYGSSKRWVSGACLPCARKLENLACDIALLLGR